MHIGWPQGIYLVLSLLTVGSFLANESIPPIAKPIKIVDYVATLLILYWGGFFG